MANRVRNKQLNLKYEDFELENIKDHYKRSGMHTMADFILTAVVRRNIISIDTTPLLKVATEISRIGNNINQFTRLCNTMKNVDKTDILAIEKMLIDVKKLITDCIHKANDAKEGKYDGVFDDKTDKN